MIDLTYLKIDHSTDTWLDDAINSNHDNVTTLTFMKPRLNLEYSKYDNIINNFNQKPINSIFKAHSTTLNKFYRPAPTTLNKKLTARRKGHNLKQCPFCGHPVKPTILDHFIPKKLWPEFSIFPNNLVNQCENCSSKKGQHYYSNADNSAKFIHPIYTNILCYVEFKFILTNVNINNLEIANIDVKVYIKKRISKNQRIRIESHLKYLEVKDYAIAYARDKYTSRIREAKQKKYYVPDLLKVRVQQYSKEINNNWQVCIYQAMLENPIIMQYFNNHRP